MPKFTPEFGVPGPDRGDAERGREGEGEALLEAFLLNLGLSPDEILAESLESIKADLEDAGHHPENEAGRILDHIEVSPGVAPSIHPITEFPLERPRHDAEHGPGVEETRVIDVRRFIALTILDERLPWLEPELDLTRKLASEESDPPRYRIRARERSDAVHRFGELRVALVGTGGEFSVLRLCAERLHGEFTGEPLPADWGRIGVQISVDD